MTLSPGTSGVHGWEGALKLLLRMLTQRRLHWFAGYCVILGISTLLWQTLSPPVSQAPQAAVTVSEEAPR